MQTTTTTHTVSPSASRRAVVSAFAVVGFITLFVLGIWLAIYGARQAPEVMSRLNGAAVSLSSLFRSDDEASLNVVGPSSFPVEDQEPATATSTEDTPSEEPADSSTGGTSTGGSSGSVTAGGPLVFVPTDPYGDPDLTVRITAVGYLRTSDTDSFVEAREVPDNRRGAVQFTVTNSGTNVSGRWEGTVKLPTSPALTYKLPTQRSLGPGDSIDFTLGFDRPRAGDDRTITVTVDTGRDVNESNESNNSDSEQVDIER